MTKHNQDGRSAVVRLDLLCVEKKWDIWNFENYLHRAILWNSSKIRIAPVQCYVWSKIMLIKRMFLRNPGMHEWTFKFWTFPPEAILWNSSKNGIAPVQCYVWWKIMLIKRMFLRNPGMHEYWLAPGKLRTLLSVLQYLLATRNQELRFFLFLTSTCLPCECDSLDKAKMRLATLACYCDCRPPPLLRPPVPMITPSIEGANHALASSGSTANDMSLSAAVFALWPLSNPDDSGCPYNNQQ